MPASCSSHDRPGRLASQKEVDCGLKEIAATSRVPFASWRFSNTLQWQPYKVNIKTMQKKNTAILYHVDQWIKQTLLIFLQVSALFLLCWHTCNRMLCCNCSLSPTWLLGSTALLLALALHLRCYSQIMFLFFPCAATLRQTETNWGLLRALGSGQVPAACNWAQPRLHFAFGCNRDSSGVLGSIADNWQ